MATNVNPASNAVIVRVFLNLISFPLATDCPETRCLLYKRHDDHLLLAGNDHQPTFVCISTPPDLELAS